MSRHKHKTSEGTPNAAEAPPEPREQTNGFEFPVGVASGQATPVKFYCYAAQCPGYSYSASDQAHPVETCGTLMNSLDNPLHANGEGKVPEIMKENAQSGAAVAAVESTGFSTDRLSGIFTEGKTASHDAIDPDLFAAAWGDGKTASQPEALDASEVHTDAQASEHPIALEDVIEEEQAELAKSARTYDAIEMRGSLGMFFEQPVGAESAWIEVLAAESQGFIQLCHYRSANGVDSWTVLRTDFSGWMQAVPFSGFRRVVTRDETPQWVQALRAQRIEAFDEGIIGTSSEEPAESAPSEAAPLEPKALQLTSVGMRCAEIATELDIETLQVMRLVDGLLQTFGQLVSFKELVSSTPMIPALFDHFLSPDARAKLMTLVGGMANGPIRKVINDAAQSAVDEFETKLAEVNEQLVTLQTSVIGKNAEFENEDGSKDPLLDAIDKIGTALARTKDDHDRALGTIEGQIALLADKLDTINSDLSTLEGRMDEVQPDWKPSKGKKAAKAKPSQPPKAPVASEFDDDEDEIIDVDDEDDEDDDQDPLEDLDDDEEDAVDAVARPASRLPSTSIGRAVIDRVGLLASRRAPPKPASKPIRRGRPPKPNVAPRGKLDMSPKPRKHIKKARGRAAVLKREKMPPVDNRPMTGKIPTTAGLRMIDEFMGRKKNPKIRVLLSKVPSAKLGKFIDDSKKGFFNMQVTGWDLLQQSAFIKWFYARK